MQQLTASAAVVRSTLPSDSGVFLTVLGVGAIVVVVAIAVVVVLVRRARR